MVLLIYTGGYFPHIIHSHASFLGMSSPVFCIITSYVEHEKRYILHILPIVIHSILNQFQQKIDPIYEEAPSLSTLGNNLFIVVTLTDWYKWHRNRAGGLGHGYYNQALILAYLAVFLLICLAVFLLTSAPQHIHNY